ncbi:MAG TPA: DUF222 domain-containing protein [Mycobacteriales bacterium]|nr:DUF222 domain-containing protein [Mycobacteriales bacterium]
MERLEAEIVVLATQLSSATARLLVMIGEFDAAEGWRDWGMRSTAHWLTWKCGIGMTAAREQVRVARKLPELPLVSQAFHEGRLSYSKVRALTRCATPEKEADLVAAAECATAAQMEQLQAGLRRARRGDDVRKRHAARGVRYHFDDDGSMVGTFRLPPEQGARFIKGLDVARGRTGPVGEDENASAEAPRSRATSAQSTADAMVAMADALVAAASAEASPHRTEQFQLVIHSSLDALAQPDQADDDGAGSELANGVRLAPSTARRLTCNCPTTTMTSGPDGQILHAGRRTRRIRGRLLRAVNARDRGRCRAPGCTEAATQIHHVRHWANGGPTCLPNLISLCDQHHWLVHEGGFTLVPRTPGIWALLSPAGVTIDQRPAAADAVPPLLHDPTLDPDAVSGHWDGRPLRVHDTCAALTSERRRRTTLDGRPEEPSQPVESSRRGDPDTPRYFTHDAIIDFVTKMRAMQRRGETSPHIIYGEDDDD